MAVNAGAPEKTARGPSRGQPRGTNWYKPAGLAALAFSVVLAYQNCAPPLDRAHESSLASSEDGFAAKPVLNSKYHVTSYSSREGAMSCAVVEPEQSVRCSGNFFFSLFSKPPAKAFESVEIEGSAGAVKVVNSHYYGCALMADKKVKCWGSNNLGQLGSDQPAIRLEAREVPGLANVAEIVTAVNTACALVQDGTVWCWGDNSVGLVGVDTETKNYSEPQQVLGVSNATQLSVGSNHACVRLKNNVVMCWGDNGFGQVGHDVESVSRRPVQVAGIDDAAEVSAGYGTSFTCARLNSGKVMCWGDNRYGQLGDGTNTNSSRPVEVSRLAAAKQISSGAHSSCAVDVWGKVFCWGAAGMPTGYGKTPVEIPTRDLIENLQATQFGFVTVKAGSVLHYHGAKGDLYQAWEF